MRILLCLLLATLFLYNPFLSAVQETSELAVCHPASHRGTVGSSELESFARPDASAQALCVAEFEQGFAELLAIELSSSSFVGVQKVMAVPQAGFSASLWFRPPPSA